MLEEREATPANCRWGSHLDTSGGEGPLKERGSSRTKRSISEDESFLGEEKPASSRGRKETQFFALRSR